jgi:uncharacterized membrane protein YhhN
MCFYVKTSYMFLCVKKSPVIYPIAFNIFLMRFTYLFIAIVIADLIAVSMASKPLEYVFKPAIMLALGIYFYQQAAGLTDKKQRNRVLLGTFFSLLGDVFLMFSGGFILGLASFLIAHIFYISAFYLDNDGFITQKRDRWAAVAGIFAYGVVFLSSVLPKVDGALVVPVGVYGLTILTMLLMALNRWKTVHQETFQWVFLGAVLFVISDSILAINKFVQPLPMSGIAIMLTYAAGQFFIVNGVLKGMKS